jgi:hypothetical protein
MNHMHSIPKYLPDGKVMVCAWCYPGDSVFNTFPVLASSGVISHGICPHHFKRMTDQLTTCKEKGVAAR